jgi:hypothetical protein
MVAGGEDVSVGVLSLFLGEGSLAGRRSETGAKRVGIGHKPKADDETTS